LIIKFLCTVLDSNDLNSACDRSHLILLPGTRQNPVWGRELICIYCRGTFVDGAFLPKRGHMNSDAHVLIVSNDQMLLQTRRLILGSYFRVATAGRVSYACSLLAQQTFDRVVLCHTLSDGECQQVIGLVDEQKEPPTEDYYPKRAGATLFGFRDRSQTHG